jgi:hypothetical protein
LALVVVFLLICLLGKFAWEPPAAPSILGLGNRERGTRGTRKTREAKETRGTNIILDS